MYTLLQARGHWPILFLATLLTAAIAEDPKGLRRDVPYEISYCFETNLCGIQSLGSYKLGPTENHTSMGHIYQIKNGLPLDIVFYWDVTGILQSGGGFQAQRQLIKHAIKVKGLTTRYFDSQVYATHTIRLFIKDVDSVDPGMNETAAAEDVRYEAVDKAIGKEENQCAGGRRNKVCDYLFRLCYQNKFSNTTQCDEYELACPEFITNSEGEECIESCAFAHYSHLLEGAEKTSFKVNRLDIVKYLIKQAHARDKKELGSVWRSIDVEEESDCLMRAAQLKASDDAVLTSANTTVVIVVIILILVLLAFFCAIWFWGKTLGKAWINAWGGNTMEEKEKTLSNKQAYM